MLREAKCIETTCISRLLCSENVEISGNKYYQDDKWSDEAEVELNYLVLRELNSVSGISFCNKAVPAPALLKSTEEEEEHRKNVSIQFRGGLTLDDVKQQRGANPFFVPEARKNGERGEANYPEPSAHGIQPAWGFSISNAENIRLKNVKLELINPDERPKFYFKNTKKIRFR